MRKTYKLIIIILILIFVILFCIKPIFNLACDSFGYFVFTQLDNEEQERQKKAESGEIIRGKDTVLIWEDKFEICYNSGEKYLLIEINGISQSVLQKIREHKVINENLYILSDEGYGVIDKNSICKLFITASPEQFINGYTVDSDGIKHSISRFLKDDHIKYLSSYNDFTEEERKVFEEMLTHY